MIFDNDLLDEDEYDDDDDFPPPVAIIHFIPPPEVRTFIGYRKKEKYSYNSAVNVFRRSIRNKNDK